MILVTKIGSKYNQYLVVYHDPTNSYNLLVDNKCEEQELVFFSTNHCRQIKFRVYGDHVEGGASHGRNLNYSVADILALQHISFIRPPASYRVCE